MPDPLDLSQLNLPTGTQDNPPPQEPNSTGTNPNWDSFIANVSDDHKDIVKQYLPDWDKQVTQQFQKIHEEYKPYKDLGADPETIQNALQIIQFADADPVGFYQYVKELIIESGLELPDEMDPTQDNQPDPSVLPEYEGLNPQFVEKFTQIEQTLNKFGQFVDQFQAEQETQKNQQQLDNLLKELHTTHGDFDEPAILGRIMQGMKPEDAVKDYKSKVTQAKNSPPPPPTLNSGGTPLDQVDRSKLKDSNSRKAIIADLLTKAAQA